MKKIIKWILIGLAVVFVVIQLFPKNLPENKPADDRDILAMHDVPTEVANILKVACYDCHSNQVNYPWYSYIAPVSFLIAHDVNEGREELNFSEWGDYEKKRKIKKLDEIIEETEEGKMPLPIYVALHSEADLSEEQVAALHAWAEALTEQLFDSSPEDTVTEQQD